MPKLVDHDVRRSALAAAAVDAIAAQGLDAVRLADIARAAGCTTGMLSHYFPDKDALLTAALESVSARLLQHIEATTPVDPVAQILAVLPLDAANHADWRVWLAFWGRAAFAAPLRAVHQRHYAEIEAALMRALGADRNRCTAVIAIIDGLGARACMEPDAWPAPRLRALAETLLTPLFAQKGP